MLVFSLKRIYPFYPLFGWVWAFASIVAKKKLHFLALNPNTDIRLTVL